METRKPLKVTALDPLIREFNTQLANAFCVDANKIEPAGKIYQVLWRFIEIILFNPDHLDQKGIEELFEHSQKELTESSWLKAHDLIIANAALSPAKRAMLNATFPLFKALSLWRWMMLQLEYINARRFDLEQKVRNYLLTIVPFAHKNPSDNKNLVDLEAKIRQLKRSNFEAKQHPLIVAYQAKLNKELDAFELQKKHIHEDLTLLTQRAKQKVQAYHEKAEVFGKQIAGMTLQSPESPLAAAMARLTILKNRLATLKASLKARDDFFDEEELNRVQALVLAERENWQAQWQALCQQQTEQVTARSELELMLLKERLEVSRYINSALQDLELATPRHYLSPVIKVTQVDSRQEYIVLRELCKTIKEEVQRIQSAQREVQVGKGIIADYCQDMSQAGREKINGLLYLYPMAQYKTNLDKAKAFFVEEANNQYSLLGSQYYRLWSSVKTALETLFNSFMPALESDIAYLQTIKVEEYINGLICPLQKLGSELEEKEKLCEQYIKRLKAAHEQYGQLFLDYEEQLNTQKTEAFDNAASQFQQITKRYQTLFNHLLLEVNGQHFEIKVVNALPADPLEAEFKKVQQTLAKIKKQREPKVSTPAPKSLKNQIREIERITLAAKIVEGSPVSAAQAPINPPKQPNWFQRIWPQALTGLGSAGCGAGIGFAVGLLLAPVTFGAAPWVFALLGATIFATLGVLGFIGVKRCVQLHRKSQAGSVQPRKTSDIFSRLSIKQKTDLTSKPPTPVSPAPSAFVTPTSAHLALETSRAQDLSRSPVGFSRSQ